MIVCDGARLYALLTIAACAAAVTVLAVYLLLKEDE